MRDIAIGELSKRTNVKIETIRYYEKIGIMPKPPRNSSGYRVYARAHLERLSFVRRSRELGFTQEEIRKLLNLVDGYDYTCGEIRQITEEHLATVKAKRRDLEKIESALSAMVSKCEHDEIPDCPVIDVLFGLESETG